MKTLVFRALIELVQIKGAKNKCVSAFDVSMHLQNEMHVPNFPRQMVELTLDMMIGDRAVKYYDSRYNGRTYRYFGIPKGVMAQYEAKYGKLNIPDSIPNEYVEGQPYQLNPALPSHAYRMRQGVQNPDGTFTPPSEEKSKQALNAVI